ncbi:ABC transporter ATP-binding protein [Kocuria oceani]|uniref:ABC transporter ATP-binding protein n=1 Tax=Kocuria oceani TaxID=988827 RepID=UPI00403713C5
MASVTFDGATRIFDPESAPAVDHLDLEVADGEFLVLVGPSGCGKSTSLRMLAGLEPTSQGRILIGGQDVTGVRPKDRDVAMVFQSYALYPNMTARQNMAFALENAKLPKQQIARRVEEAANILELGPLLDRKPARMSGGQRQRVAMGRAIVRQPAVFCMDEPLSNLDAKLRVSTRAQIADLQREFGTTTVYVTHDQTEAMTMGDRVCVLLDGKLQQIDTPQALYDRPRNTFVASFIGSPALTLIDGVPVQDGHAVLDGHAGIRLPLPPRAAANATSTVTIGFRPEAWHLVPPRSKEPSLELDVHLVESLGSEKYVYATAAHPMDGVSVRNDRYTVRLGKRDTVHKGDRIAVVPLPGEEYFFDTTTGINLEHP